MQATGVFSSAVLAHLVELRALLRREQLAQARHALGAQEFHVGDRLRLGVGYGAGALAEAKASFSRSPRAARIAFMRSRIAGDWSWKILNTWSRCASLRSRWRSMRCVPMPWEGIGPGPSSD